jgi:hypothetical protein
MACAYSRGRLRLGGGRARVAGQKVRHLGALGLSMDRREEAEEKEWSGLLVCLTTGHRGSSWATNRMEPRASRGLCAANNLTAMTREGWSQHRLGE